MQAPDTRRYLLDEVVAEVECLQLAEAANRFRNFAYSVAAEREQMQAGNDKKSRVSIGQCFMNSSEVAERLSAPLNSLRKDSL